MIDAKKNVTLIGVPVQSGAGRGGCVMGPAALRTARLARALERQGHHVRDAGDLDPHPFNDVEVEGNARHAGEMAAWTRVIDRAGYEALQAGDLPIFMGGDHSLAMGSINACARFAETQGRGLSVIWLDAHADFNSPHSSPSGNVHGMPVAALCGVPGLDFIFDGMVRGNVDPHSIYQFGIRSVDDIERRAIVEQGVNVYDMRVIDEHGFSSVVASTLQAVADKGDMLHVSLDVDFLDPDMAPAVGTRVPGGATYREAHLIMEMLSESGLVTSVDLAELNPFLDVEGRTANLLVDLVGSLFGKRIIDRDM
ncbi:MAG: arginase [Rhodospirillales bacterium]